MPELPEVETLVRQLRPLLLGKVLRRAQARDISAFSHSPIRPSQKNLELLRGLRVLSVGRRGKMAVIGLGAPPGGAPLSVAVHLRMTGQLLWGPPHPASRALFEFQHCEKALSYVDVRRLGKIYLGETARMGGVLPRGEEPLELDREAFCGRLRERGGRIKPLLMNQNFLAGVGNIYAIEALFDAGIRPTRHASRLSMREAGRLLDSLQRALRSGIQNGGATLRNYVDAFGRPGRAQRRHRIYGKRAGTPCPRCSKPLRFIFVSQRGTVFCPGCQT
ncbi:MAG: hypothetical protein A3G41_07300 [Elusimicrobia bacterium RIFCSPLOWO2_12_FULL_59_9]|nr:MAG: hypothetical protein A3G41_07300 [Elusimicrobia bacterium RIFCSPLOWO2_12_FULL_59_9]